MITHYDMTTGEIIRDESREQPAETAAGPAETLSMRLLTVQEAVALQTPAPRLPADIVLLPVDKLISRWS